MIFWRITALAVAALLLCNCGEGEETQKAEVQPSGNNTQAPANPAPAEPAEETNERKMKELALYTNSVGAVFEILEISEDPINDTLPLDGFFDENTKLNPKSENRYVNGRLVERTEFTMAGQRHAPLRIIKYWENGGIKQEIRYNGNRATTNNYTEAGFRTGPVSAPGRLNVWFRGNRADSIENYYRGANANTNKIMRDLGPPDRIQSNTWTYKNMLFKVGNSTNRLTVNFHLGQYATNITVGP